MTIDDPTCGHMNTDENGELCDVDGTVFAVFEADVVDRRMVSPDRGFVLACPTHIVAALTAADGGDRVFVVLPVAEVVA